VKLNATEFSGVSIETISGTGADLFNVMRTFRYPISLQADIKAVSVAVYNDETRLFALVVLSQAASRQIDNKIRIRNLVEWFTAISLWFMPIIILRVWKWQPFLLRFYLTNVYRSFFQLAYQ